MKLMKSMDREILADAQLARTGFEFLAELIDRFGARFGGSENERGAADFVKEKMIEYQADAAWTEAFDCLAWRRGDTHLVSLGEKDREWDCIALPFCPSGEIKAPLVYLGDGHPQIYEEKRDAIEGAIVMVTSATPEFYHRTMHRGEKLGRALEAGAVGFIWMRGEPGGLPETGSARFGQPCEVPAISVSYETGHALLREKGEDPLHLRITSTNEVFETSSMNVVGELKGTEGDQDVIVVGAHYDGHDISQSASDNGAGTAVLLEVLRVLSPHKDRLKRTLRFVAFAQEEMGLMGAEDYAKRHQDEVAFMLNLDGAGRGRTAAFTLQGWPENVGTFKDFFQNMFDATTKVGDQIGLYSDMYPFAVRGMPAATLTSSEPATKGAPRGYGHTFWDSIDKVNPEYLQMDASRAARMLARLVQAEPFPLKPKRPEEIGRQLEAMGYSDVLRHEKRPLFTHD